MAFDDHVYKLETERYIVIPKSAPHHYGSDEKKLWTIYWIHFRGASAEYMCKNMHKPCTLTDAINSRKFERIALFEELHNALDGAPDLQISNTHQSYCSIFLPLSPISAHSGIYVATMQ